jgi:hypothetical protein
MSSMSAMPPELRRLASTSLLFTLFVAILVIAGLVFCVLNGPVWLSAGYSFLFAAFLILYVPIKIRAIRTLGHLGIADAVVTGIILVALVLHVRSSLAAGQLMTDGIAALGGLVLAAVAAAGIVEWEKRTGYSKLRDAWLASTAAREAGN